MREIQISGEWRDKDGRLLESFKGASLKNVYKMLIEKYNIDEYKDTIAEMIEKEHKKLIKEFEDERRK